MGLLSKGIAAPAPAVDPVENDQEIAEIRKSLSEPGKRRGRKPAGPDPEEIKAEALKKLFSPDQWEAIASMYPDIRYAMTGYEGFRLTDTERITLSTSLSTMMSYLVAVDPKYLAMILFLATYGSIVGKKEIEWKSVRKKEHAKSAAKAA